MIGERMCSDCGCPPWTACWCDGEAGLDHPSVRNFSSGQRPYTPPPAFVLAAPVDPDEDRAF